MKLQRLITFFMHLILLTASLMVVGAQGNYPALAASSSIGPEDLDFGEGLSVMTTNRTTGISSLPLL